MTIADELGAMTVAMENQTENRQYVYILLLRAMVTIRQLKQRIAVLEDKNNDHYTKT